ncbi:MAG: putative capsid protein [Cressdnaviricota sp.]|nr:MAG: putative capsid protein [Cressdnaviricota sp.]
MGYGSKYKYKNKYGKNKNLSKVNIMTKKSAKSQAYQINSLVNKVKALEKKQKQTRQYCQFSKAIQNVDLPLLTNSGFQIENLVDPAGWDALFQSNNEVENSNKLTMRSCSMEFYFRIVNSLLPCTPKIITVFLVKLREETAIELLNDTGQLSTAAFGVNANSGVYWETIPVGLTEDALCKLSPSAFKILKVKKFQLQNIIEDTAIVDEDTSVTSVKGTFKRFSWNIRCGNLLKSAANKKWKDMTPLDVSIKDRLYLIVHQGGAGALAPPETDNGVNMSVNCIFNCRGTN